MNLTINVRPVSVVQEHVRVKTTLVEEVIMDEVDEVEDEVIDVVTIE